MPYKDKSKHRELMSRWRKTHPDSCRNSKLKSMYGLSLDKYNEMVKKQNNLCGICGSAEDKISQKNQQIKRLSVDHLDRKDGSKLIGLLLCDDCNRGLGMFRENHELLLKAAEYRKKYSVDTN